MYFRLRSGNFDHAFLQGFRRRSRLLLILESDGADQMLSLAADEDLTEERIDGGNEAALAAALRPSSFPDRPGIGPMFSGPRLPNLRSRQKPAPARRKSSASATIPRRKKAYPSRLLAIYRSLFATTAGRAKASSSRGLAADGGRRRETARARPGKDFRIELIRPGDGKPHEIAVLVEEELRRRDEPLGPDRRGRRVVRPPVVGVDAEGVQQRAHPVDVGNNGQIRVGGVYIRRPWRVRRSRKGNRAPPRRRCGRTGSLCRRDGPGPRPSSPGQTKAWAVHPPSLSSLLRPRPSHRPPAGFRFPPRSKPPGQGAG